MVNTMLTADSKIGLNNYYYCMVMIHILHFAVARKRQQGNFQKINALHMSSSATCITRSASPIIHSQLPPTMPILCSPFRPLQLYSLKS